MHYIKIQYNKIIFLTSNTDSRFKINKSNETDKQKHTLESLCVEYCTIHIIFKPLLFSLV